MRLYCKVTIILAPQQTNSFHYKTLEGKVVQLTTDHITLTPQLTTATSMRGMGLGTPPRQSNEHALLIFTLHCSRICINNYLLKKDTAWGPHYILDPGIDQSLSRV